MEISALLNNSSSQVAQNFQMFSVKSAMNVAADNVSTLVKSMPTPASSSGPVVKNGHVDVYA